jgi:carbon storage regulator CsrA
MLVLTRKPEPNHDVIRIQDQQTGSEFTITIHRVRGKQVKLGLVAPKHYRIVRGELGPKECE